MTTTKKRIPPLLGLTILRRMLNLTTKALRKAVDRGDFPPPSTLSKLAGRQLWETKDVQAFFAHDPTLAARVSDTAILAAYKPYRPEKEIQNGN